MKKPLMILAFLFVLISCKKEADVVITGNKSNAAVGEEVELSMTASSNKKFKHFVVDAILHSNSGIQNTGRFYIHKDKTKEVNDKFSFRIPSQVINQNIVPGDYYEFTVYAETGNYQIVKVWKVVVTP